MAEATTLDAGLGLTYAALITMALGPIYFGAYGALTRLKSPKDKKKKEKDEGAVSDSSDDESEDESEVVSSEDAYMFPVYGSGVLFSLYMVFKYLNKEYITYLLTGYFSIIGVPALTKFFASIVRGITGIRLPRYHLQVTKRAKSLAHLKFTDLHLSMAVVAIGVTGYYVLTKNWIASNLFGIAFSLSAIQLIRLDSFKTGIIMLMGLFVYDIFWVFGTDVMVSVATKFDGPIKVLWPRNLLTLQPDEPYKMAMLGLGDIVVPGVFVALSLAFDRAQFLASQGYPGVKPVVPRALRRASFPKPYFTACFTAYFLGLITTMAVMHFFQAAQPALLYLSPACSLSVILVAFVRGELFNLFAFTTEEKPEDASAEEQK
ncbi:hypothetical protein IWQ61_005668 [Dispira simplex]|nr:hypothetical protein IWQ61_005668 [Dispira simplex]